MPLVLFSSYLSSMKKQAHPKEVAQAMLLSLPKMLPLLLALPDLETMLLT